MRLLNVNNLEFAEFREDNRPKYVIASHRWIEGCEVTLPDVRDKRNRDKSGYEKILGFATYVKEHVPEVEWLWVDTCCIDKTNAAELSESLNLMFDWYRNAVLCICSEWFRRGWTLQELLASRLLIFITKTWQVIGNKGASTYVDCGTRSGPGLEKDIAAITTIPERVLRDYAASIDLSVDEKLKWMEGRKTTRPEDMSYALYGIFGVTPGANYGERYEGARARLLAAIDHRDNVAAQKTERWRKIVKWLSPPNPWTNHESARQLHQPSTGSWALQSKTYQDWKTSTINHLHVWMFGEAGSGKTVLCSTVIEDIKAYCRGQPNVGYAVFYFSFSDDRKQRLADLLCSLVAQLGWQEPALSMLQQASSKPGGSALGVHDLEKILLACFAAHDSVFLLVDALDECPEGDNVRHDITSCLTRLSQKAPHVKIFATSRTIADIRVSNGKARGAATCRCSTCRGRGYPAKADGMFRWAYCQLEELKKLGETKPKYVKQLLYNLPATLDATYERMLDRIADMFRGEALTLLQ
ncbi:hypothetical protein BST61_g1331 [Cercospora zeina]